jgi:methylphosphotriester-DNA--protein-cysteine methyltransferase
MERWIEDAKKFLTGVIPQVVVSDQVTDFMAFDLKFVPQERDKMTGKKPIEFIRTIRMKRAQQLLTESQMQVSEIAYTLGYNSPKIFSKHFKEEFNISPSEFIRQQAE